MTTPEKLHILHTEASCGWGGQEIRIITESQALMERGHKVTLICNPEAPIFQKSQDLGIETIALDIHKKRLHCLMHVYKWLKMHGQRISVINTHSSTDSWLFAIANRILGKKIPIVRSRHISAPINHSFTTRWLYTKACKHIVTTGEKLKQTLINENKYPEGMITSVATGIDDEKFVPGDKLAAREKLGLPLDKQLVGIAATLRSWKGHEYLLRAMSNIKDDNVRLVIIGDGPGKPYFEEVAAEVNLGDKVMWVGHHDNIVPWLQALDLFTLPSFANEGVPQSLMQAMLCKIPVVSTDVGSITEIIEHEKTGLIVNIKDADDLQAAIEHCLGAPAFCEQMTDHAYANIKANYTKRTMGEKMEAIFLEAKG